MERKETESLRTNTIESVANQVKVWPVYKKKTYEAMVKHSIPTKSSAPGLAHPRKSPDSIIFHYWGVVALYPAFKVLSHYLQYAW
jgi:hypothetical protein